MLSDLSPSKSKLFFSANMYKTTFKSLKSRKKCVMTDSEEGGGHEQLGVCCHGAWAGTVALLAHGQ